MKINEQDVSGGELLEIDGAMDTPIAPAQGIASIALNFAMKYAEIATCKDGELYREYKMEGRNLPPLQLGWVFEVADEIEKRLLESPNRLSTHVLQTIEQMIVEAVGGEDGVNTDLAADDAADERSGA